MRAVERNDGHESRPRPRPIPPPRRRGLSIAAERHLRSASPIRTTSTSARMRGSQSFSSKFPHNFRQRQLVTASRSRKVSIGIAELMISGLKLRRVGGLPKLLFIQPVDRQGGEALAPRAACWGLRRGHVAASSRGRAAPELSSGGKPLRSTRHVPTATVRRLSIAAFEACGILRVALTRVGRMLWVSADRSAAAGESRTRGDHRVRRLALLDPVDDCLQ